MPDKAERVKRYHDRTVRALADMLAAAGLTHPDDLKPHHVVHRLSSTQIRQFDQAHHFLKDGELLHGECSVPHYRNNWVRAQADSFAAA